MSRVIKFRAWDKEGDKGLSDVVEIDFEKKIARVHGEGEGRTGRTVVWLPFFRIELMQFTGLTDKNGKEIYEGDILRIPNNYDKYGQYAGDCREVAFNDGSFRLKPKWDTTSKGNYFADVNEELEVIGNIYQNSDLLV